MFKVGQPPTSQPHVRPQQRDPRIKTFLADVLLAVADRVDDAVRAARRHRVRQTLGACGAGVTFETVLALEHPERIHVASGTYFGHDLVMKAMHGYDGAIRIGDGCVIVNQVQLLSAYGIELGRGVTIGSRVTIVDHNHGMSPGRSVFKQPFHGAPVRIGDYCWIGEGAIILPGVNLGEGCVVGANAVVTKSFEPYAIIAGVPARIVSRRDAPCVLSTTHPDTPST